MIRSKTPGKKPVEILPHHLDQGEDTTGKIPTRASKLKTIALGVLLTAAGLLIIFLAWASIFLVASYLLGWR
jgi:hypothetical protein